MALRARRESGSDCQPAIARGLGHRLGQDRWEPRRTVLWVQAARSGVSPLAPAAVARQPAVAGAYRANDAELARLLGPSALPHRRPHRHLSNCRAQLPPRPQSRPLEQEFTISDRRPSPRTRWTFPFRSAWQSSSESRASKWPFIGGLAAVAAILVLVSAPSYC